MKRRFLLILLAAALGLSACQAQKPSTGTEGQNPNSGSNTQTQSTEPQTDPQAPETESTSEAEPVLPEIPAEEGLGFSVLDNGLLAYLRANGMESKSFTVSPLSFKAALALTALGAEGETQRQILDALGFATVEEMSEWYAGVLVGVADFEGRIYGEDKKDSAYRVVNAIFHNANCDGMFRDSYKELVARTMAAQANSAPASEITAEINRWVNDQTNGMIPQLVQDASQSACVLVNALYLKTKWTEAFQNAEITDFTTAAGSVVQKPFITKTEKYRYYEDESCQLVEIPMQGGVNLILILGDGTDVSRKLESAKVRKVRVTLPKFEVETSLDEKQLIKYLQSIGCGRLFVDGAAEFDPMFTEGIYVDDIIQKAKVKLDENGMEAAAATAVIMMRNTAMPNPEEPVEFTADRPFSFLICRQDADPELLFWGQIMD